MGSTTNSRGSRKRFINSHICTPFNSGIGTSDTGCGQGGITKVCLWSICVTLVAAGCDIQPCHGDLREGESRVASLWHFRIRSNGTADDGGKVHEFFLVVLHGFCLMCNRRIAFEAVSEFYISIRATASEQASSVLPGLTLAIFFSCALRLKTLDTVHVDKDVGKLGKLLGIVVFYDL